MQNIISEIYAPLPMNLFPDVEPHYIVGSFGFIYNSKLRTRIPRKTPNKNQYVTIALTKIGGGTVYAQPHRIVLMTFNYIPGCENLDVNHKDGIKFHNWLWNLEWATRSENIQHALRTGLFNVGETRENTKYTEQEIRTICDLIAKGLVTKDIEEMTGIDRHTIQNIKNGHCWKHISCEYDFSNAYKRN